MASDEGRQMTASEAAALFPRYTARQRAEVLMKSGRIDVAAQEYVVAHMEALVKDEIATATADLRDEVQGLRGLLRDIRDCCRMDSDREREHWLKKINAALAPAALPAAQEREGQP